jgi:hypothetical protein
MSHPAAKNPSIQVASPRALLFMRRRLPERLGLPSPSLSSVGDGSKVENRDGSKVNWDNLKGKMAEDVGPYQIGRFLKDPDFGLRVIKDGYGLFKGWSNFVGSAFEFNGMINSDFSGRSQGEMQVEEG